VNFDLSPEQWLLEKTVGSYLLAEHPVSRTRTRLEQPDDDFADVWDGLSAMGLAGPMVPEQFGGLGLGVLDLAVAAQAVGYGAAPAPLLGHWLAALALDRAGSAEQRERWLPGLSSGAVRAALVWDDAGTPVLGGRGADVFVRRSGDELAVVPAGPSVAVRRLAGIDLTRPIDEVTIADGAAEPLPGTSAAVVAFVRSVGHVLVAADAFGGALRCLELSVDYAKTRQQWGQVIGRFQAVKHQLADLALLVEPARGLYWYAAHALDAVRPDAADAGALAKSHITDGSLRAARTAVELHGGFGYTWECDLHVYLKRALLNRQYLGDPESLRQEIATRTLSPANGSG
jgi:alkylation response protein AidB-like acyl-CoA dehydrogenase